LEHFPDVGTAFSVHGIHKYEIKKFRYFGQFVILGAVILGVDILGVIPDLPYMTG